jgi:hypothetical protein
MKLELDSRDSSTFKYDQLFQHVLGKCATTDARTLVERHGAHTELSVSCYTIPAGVPLTQMPTMADFVAIPNKVTPAPVQVMEEIPTTIAENIIDTIIDNMIKVYEAWTFQLSKVNELRDRGYQNARAYTIAADHSPLHTPMNFLPPTAPLGPAYY